MMQTRLDLWDWRRRVAALYAAIRAAETPAAGWALWIATRAALFRDHPQSPLPPSDRAGFTGPRCFDYDAALRLAVGLTAASDAAPRTVEAGADGTLVLTPFARTAGLAAAFGGELTLFWIGGYGGGVFLPFADATSGSETYGGGRYLLDTIKGADLGRDAQGRILLDFNFSYFPSCAYTPDYVCPLAPPENRLPRPVRAGERLRVYSGAEVSGSMAVSSGRTAPSQSA
jgi:uncharacterized protein (DUF1684 family)